MKKSDWNFEEFYKWENSTSISILVITNKIIFLEEEVPNKSTNSKGIFLNMTSQVLAYKCFSKIFWDVYAKEWRIFRKCFQGSSSTKNHFKDLMKSKKVGSEMKGH